MVVWRGRSKFCADNADVGSDKKELRVVCDQIGCPTYTKDLVCKTGEMIQTNQYGTYHVSNRGNVLGLSLLLVFFREWERMLKSSL